jgi:hypothetical protein
MRPFDAAIAEAGAGRRQLDIGQQRHGFGTLIIPAD